MDAQYVAIRVAKPGGLKVSDRCDAMLSLEFGKVVLLEGHPAAPQFLYLCPHVGDLPRRERMLRVSCSWSLVYLKRGAITAAVDHLRAGCLGSRVSKAERVLEEIARACEIGGRNYGSYLSIRKHSFSSVAGATLFAATSSSSNTAIRVSLFAVDDDGVVHFHADAHESRDPRASSRLTAG